MKWARFLCAVTLAALAMATVAAHGQEYVPGEALVKFRSGLPSQAAVDAAVPKATVKEHLAEIGVTVVQLPGNVPVDAAVKRFAARPDVEFAEPNYVAHTCQGPPPVNDPMYANQWALPLIKAPSAWILAGAGRVSVAVLDTGIDLAHEDLPTPVASQDFTGKGSVADGNGHGTHTAGTVAALTNNSTGVASLGREHVSLMIGKVLDDRGSGAYSWVINGINWAVNNGAKVISMSLGGSSGSTAMRNAIDDAWNKGVVIVAAAGNSNTTRASYPAYYTNCIAVAATDQNDAKASFSNYGSWVDVAAPGVGILSTYKGNQYASLSGTSMATPHVAALAALIWATYPGVTKEAVRTGIETTGVPVSVGFKRYPTRRIDAESALMYPYPK